MKQAGKANPNEFPEPVREKPEITPLPPSDDPWWGEAEINTFKKQDAPKPNCGDFTQKGPYVICGKCPNPHTIPGVTLDKDGNISKS